MKCPKCGNNLSDKATFCPKCGSRVKIENSSYGGASPTPYPKDENSQPPRKSNVGLIVVLVILLLALVSGGTFAGYKLFLEPAMEKNDSGWGSGRDKDEDKDEDEDEDEDKDEDKDKDEDTAEEETTVESAAADMETITEVPAATTAAWGTGVPATTAAWGTTGVPATTAAWNTETPAATAAWGTGTVVATEAGPYESGYVIPDSSTRYLTAADLTGMDSAALRLARNEIYARHGRRFKDQELQAYFDSQPWYIGSVAPEQFSDMTMLNEIERKNLEVIKAREAQIN